MLTKHHPTNPGFQTVFSKEILLDTIWSVSAGAEMYFSSLYYSLSVLGYRQSWGGGHVLPTT